MVDDDTALIYGIQLIPGLESSSPFIGSHRLSSSVQARPVSGSGGALLQVTKTKSRAPIISRYQYPAWEEPQ